MASHVLEVKDGLKWANGPGTGGERRQPVIRNGWEVEEASRVYYQPSPGCHGGFCIPSWKAWRTRDDGQVLLKTHDLG